MKKVAIIGAGIVGTAVGHILQKKGYEIVSVASRTENSLKRASAYINSKFTLNPVEATSEVEIILITTKDDQIKEVCANIANNYESLEGKIFLHMSGALSNNVLESAQQKEAEIGSFHPIQTFASIDGAIENLPGSVFGVTVGQKIFPIVDKLVRDLGGKSLKIDDDKKPIYHAAACVVCNYLVALMHFGQGFYQAMGISPEDALKSFWPLVKGTISNIEKLGTAKALTGPIARGDIGTIEKHLKEMEKIAPDKIDLYKKFGVYTIQVAMEKGTIKDEQAQKLLEILG